MLMCADVQLVLRAVYYVVDCCWFVLTAFGERVYHSGILSGNLQWGKWFAVTGITLVWKWLKVTNSFSRPDTSLLRQNWNLCSYIHVHTCICVWNQLWMFVLSPQSLTDLLNTSNRDLKIREDPHVHNSFIEFGEPLECTVTPLSCFPSFLSLLSPLLSSPLSTNTAQCDCTRTHRTSSHWTRRDCSPPHLWRK